MISLVITTKMTIFAVCAITKYNILISLSNLHILLNFILITLSLYKIKSLWRNEHVFRKSVSVINCLVL